MQKIFRIRNNNKIAGFISFGGNSRDRRKAARAYQNQFVGGSYTITVQRVRGATSTVPVKNYVGG